jgi:hypothetical protein
MAIALLLKLSNLGAQNFGLTYYTEEFLAL